MPEIVRWALAVLATWRLASSLYYQDGPGDAWLKLRLWAQGRSPFVQKQLSCFWCCCGWAALAVWPAAVWVPGILVPLALSGAAILLTHGGRIIWRDMAEGG